MRFRRLTFLFFVFALVGAAPQAYGKEQWTSVRSKNFYLVGDASEKELTRAAKNFEEFREALTRLFPTLRFNSPVPITVIVFNNEKSFKPFKPLNEQGKPTEWTAGYFHPREDANYIVMSADGDRQQVYKIIFHEYFHFVAKNTFGRSQMPPWLNEGLAEYYDSTEIAGSDRVRVGNLNNNHLYTLRNNRLIPLDEFLAYDHYTLNRQKGHGANIFYAQSWAFMHFLIHGNGGARAPLVNRYLNAVMQGSDAAEAFPKVFGSSTA